MLKQCFEKSKFQNDFEFPSRNFEIAIPKFKLFLGASNLDEGAVEHIWRTLQISSITDFVIYMEHDKYEPELGPFVFETLPKAEGTVYPLGACVLYGRRHSSSMINARSVDSRAPLKTQSDH